jgi:hypothetical protein
MTDKRGSVSEAISQKDFDALVAKDFDALVAKYKSAAGRAAEANSELGGLISTAVERARRRARPAASVAPRPRTPAPGADDGGDPDVRPRFLKERGSGGRDGSAAGEAALNSCLSGGGACVNAIGGTCHGASSRN